MPLPTTHALVPLAGALAFSESPLPKRLISAAGIAAALPDIDWITSSFWPKPLLGDPASIYWHRGAAHSLFVALAAGLLAAMFHKRLKVDRLTAGVVIGAAMASHGFLDMLTDYGEPVAYIWPLSSARLFADWRPIHTGPIRVANFLDYLLVRQRLELWQLILPMFAVVLVIRIARASFRKLGELRP